MSIFNLEEQWRKLQSARSTSLLHRYLTKDLLKVLRDRRTSSGATLLDSIRSGLENPDSSIGVYAPDAEAYKIFLPLFRPIISDYHGASAALVGQPALEFGNPSALTNLDPEAKYIKSTRIRCARSLQAFPFNPMLTQNQYLDIESRIEDVVSSFQGDLRGSYLSLADIPETERQQLVDDHILFKNEDRFLKAANASRHWPTGRGIFFNRRKTFLIWVNEEDHIRIISMEAGADLKSVYTRFVAALKVMSSRLQFAHDQKLGFLTMCPTNIGTTIRASVHIQLPSIGEERLREEAERLGLQVRGTKGEHSEGEGGVWDVSNKRRLGLTEWEVVSGFSEGIRELIRIEQDLKSASETSDGGA